MKITRGRIASGEVVQEQWNSQFVKTGYLGTRGLYIADHPSTFVVPAIIPIRQITDYCAKLYALQLAFLQPEQKKR